MSPPATSRVKLRREPKRGRDDRASVDRILDRALVAHIAFVTEGQPYCIPTLCARIGDHALIHGSSASRMLRGLSAGAPACLTATLTDGLVLARSAFEHSINCESAMVLGTLEAVLDPERKRVALEAFTEKLLPGRWAEVRQPTARELKATTILSLAIDEASAKVRSGPPETPSEDEDLDVWAGVVPVHRAPCGGSGIPCISSDSRSDVTAASSKRK